MGDQREEKRGRRDDRSHSPVDWRDEGGWRDVQSQRKDEEWERKRLEELTEQRERTESEQELQKLRATLKTIMLARATLEVSMRLKSRPKDAEKLEKLREEEAKALATMEEFQTHMKWKGGDSEDEGDEEESEKEKEESKKKEEQALK